MEQAQKEKIAANARVLAARELEHKATLKEKERETWRKQAEEEHWKREAEQTEARQRERAEQLRRAKWEEDEKIRKWNEEQARDQTKQRRPQSSTGPEDPASKVARLQRELEAAKEERERAATRPVRTTTARAPRYVKNEHGDFVEDPDDVMSPAAPAGYEYPQEQMEATDAPKWGDEDVNEQLQEPLSRVSLRPVGSYRGALERHQPSQGPCKQIHEKPPLLP